MKRSNIFLLFVNVIYGLLIFGIGIWSIMDGIIDIGLEMYIIPALFPLLTLGFLFNDNRISSMVINITGLTYLFIVSLVNAILNNGVGSTAVFYVFPNMSVFGFSEIITLVTLLLTKEKK